MEEEIKVVEQEAVEEIEVQDEPGGEEEGRTRWNEKFETCRNLKL